MRTPTKYRKGRRIYWERYRRKLRQQRRQGDLMRRRIYLARKAGTLPSLLRRYAAFSCGTCGARGVKLWRPYGCFYRSDDNRCGPCCDAAGKPHDSPYSRGWLVPLMLGPNGEIWGYTSVPLADMLLWDALPDGAPQGGSAGTADGKGGPTDGQR